MHRGVAAPHRAVQPDLPSASPKPVPLLPAASPIAPRLLGRDGTGTAPGRLQPPPARPYL